MFTNPNLIKSETGMLIANLEMGVQFVDDLTEDKVKGIEKGEFIRKVHE